MRYDFCDVLSACDVALSPYFFQTSAFPSLSTPSFFRSVPAVCTTKYNTIMTLLPCLQDKCNLTDRRFALLILNNLCIPGENKAAILFGETCEPLLTALLQVVQHRLAESYLALVTILNLSYIPDINGKVLLLNFGASANRNDPSSLLHTLETVLNDFAPHVQHKNSVEQQCCRWSMNILRRLLTTHEAAYEVTVRAVSVVESAVSCLEAADTVNLKNWTKDSLEDASLMVLVHLVQHEDCLEILVVDHGELVESMYGVCDTLAKSTVNLHQQRAVAVMERLESAVKVSSTRSVGYSV
jgi:hypothetical protein